MLGGAAFAAPRAVRAQPAAMPVIGLLKNTTAGASAFQVAASRQGLKEMGYDEGRNVVIEYYYADNNYDRLSELAADIVQRKVDLILAAGDNPALAAKAATPTIPIVFAVAGDPVQLGVVGNLNRPGGNITGVSFFSVTIMPKRLGLLHELAPNATVIGMLANPSNASAEAEVKDREAQPVCSGVSFSSHVRQAHPISILLLLHWYSAASARLSSPAMRSSSTSANNSSRSRSTTRYPRAIICATTPRLAG